MKLPMTFVRSQSPAWRRGYADAYGGPGICREAAPASRADWKAGRAYALDEQAKQPRSPSES